MKHPIPTHDPQTGELNPYYEELTGEKNPMSSSTERPETFALDTLIGRKFRYNGKYGLSTWTDTVADVVSLQCIEFDKPWPWFKISADGKAYMDAEHLKIIGYCYHLYVRATRTSHLYEFDKCIFLKDDE